MLNESISNAPQYRSQSLCNIGHLYETPLGCIACPDRPTCGGVQMAARVFSCLDFCCGKPDNCEKVCRLNAAEYAASLREVSSWSLDNVPRQSPLPSPLLPVVLPLIDHGSKRRRAFDGAAAICLPLYKVIDRCNDTPRFSTKAAVAAHFQIHEAAIVILSGTDRDRHLERWWSLNVHRRRDAIRRLRDLGIDLVTTPNYSLFTNVPRWGNMFNMKRIALAHEEFLAEGMAAGLHVNARTEWDWERWIEYVRARSEVTHVAYEFGTGASCGPRLAWHAHHLGLLAREAGRPLHLVVRGGTSALSKLMSEFANVTFIDTNAFTKTARARQRAYFAGNRLRWRSSPTGQSEALDEHLLHNWNAVAKDFAAKFGGTTSQTKGSGSRGTADVLCC